MYLPRWLVLAFSLGGCGSPGAPDAPGADATPDTQTSQCLPLGVTGQFQRRAGNPRLLPGRPFTDGKMSVGIADPDVRWDATASRYELYYSAPHATAFADEPERLIRRATSTDRMTWTVDDAPVLRPATDPNGWDHERVEAPTVVYNPAAPPDRRYLMLYAGAAGQFPFPGYGFPEHAIGAAFSADGVTFTRVPAAASPHGQEGLVLTGKQVYPASGGAIVTDPELAVVGDLYHVWFSSFACGEGCGGVTDRGVGHAVSADGITWVIDEAPVRSLLRAAIDRTSGGRKPSVVYDEPRCRYELWLTNDLQGQVDAQPVAADNAVGVYHADSTDGRNWSLRYDRPRDHEWSAAAPGEGLGLAAGADVAQNGTGRLMLYPAYDDENVPAEFTLLDRMLVEQRPGVTTLNVATRDLP